MGLQDGPPVVWLWLSGSYTGASVSLGRAQEAAGEAMAASGQPALVEHAWLIHDSYEGHGKYVPMGRRFDGHLGDDNCPVWGALRWAA